MTVIGDETPPLSGSISFKVAMDFGALDKNKLDSGNYYVTVQTNKVMAFLIRMAVHVVLGLQPGL